MPTSHLFRTASSRGNAPAKVIPTFETLSQKIEEAKEQKTKITPSLPMLKLPGKEVPLATSKQADSSQKSAVSVTSSHQNQVKTEGSSSQTNTEVVDMELDSDTEQQQNQAIEMERNQRSSEWVHIPASANPKKHFWD